MSQAGRILRPIDKPILRVRADAIDAARLANCDRLRIVAIIEIVAFHVPESSLRVFAGIGLPLFLLLSVAFSVRRLQIEPTGMFIRKRAARLLAPWVFWSGIYAIYLVYNCYRVGQPYSEPFELRMLWAGTFYHLWFLPMLFIGGVVAHLLHRVTRSLALPWVGAGATVVGVLMLALVQLYHGGLESPYGQWWFSGPAILLGFALGRALSNGSGVWGRHAYRRTALLLLPLALLVGWWFPLEPVARYELAIVALLLAIAWPGKGDRLTSRLQPLICGIYLVHPLVLLGLYSWMGQSWSLWVYAPVALVLSAALVQIIRQTPLRGFV